MNFSFYWRALWAQPTSILSITPQSATLTSFTDQSKPYAVFTPIPYLLNANHILTAGFQLRDFLEKELPVQEKKPFSLIINIPPSTSDPCRLATQLAALLMSLNIPPFGATAQLLPLQINKIECLFNSNGYQLRRLIRGTFSLCIASLCLAASAGAFWLYTPTKQQVPAPTAQHTPPPPGSRPPLCPQKTIIPLLCALALDAPHHQLIRASYKGKSSTYQSVATHPDYAQSACHILSAASCSLWKRKKPRYFPGYPPLYYCSADAKWELH